MPALEPLRGLRVVADPVALDAAQSGSATTSRSSCDSRRTRRSLVGAHPSVDVDDPHAIVEPEHGLSRRAT